jgi:hypothetical protein
MKHRDCLTNVASTYNNVTRGGVVNSRLVNSKPGTKNIVSGSIQVQGVVGGYSILSRDTSSAEAVLI